MGFKAWAVKLAIDMTPNFLISSVANILLKGIAEISDFAFDLDSRTAYINILLEGENEAIEVSVDGFGVTGDESSHQFIIQQASSNKVWMNNILSRVVEKRWPIPDHPQHQAQIDLLAELLKLENSD